MLGSHLLRNIEVNTEDNKELIILIHGHWAVYKGPAHSPQPARHVGLLVSSNLSSPPLLQVLCQLTPLDSSPDPRSQEGQTLQEAQALSPHHLHTH